MTTFETDPSVYFYMIETINKMREAKLNDDDIATRLMISKSTVLNIARLGKLPTEVMKAILLKKISVANGYTIARLANHSQMIIAMNETMQCNEYKKMNCKEICKRIKALNGCKSCFDRSKKID